MTEERSPHPEESLRTLAIVGLGLIGGSLARDWTARGARVLGHDRDVGSVRAALRDGEIHAALGPDLEGLEHADALVVAVPVLAAPAVLRVALPRLHRARLVTDVGSTKRSIVAAAEALGLGNRFVGAHPLAGDHCSGWNASRTGLFVGARVFLSPSSNTGGEAITLARDLWTGVGAHIEIIDAARHDQQLAWTSHLPQATSSALALTLAAAEIPRADLGPGGRDATRLAGSSPQMWTDIALDNAAALAQALTAVEEHLRDLRLALIRTDPDAVRRWFAVGQQWSRGGEETTHRG